MSSGLGLSPEGSKMKKIFSKALPILVSPGHGVLANCRKDRV